VKNVIFSQGQKMTIMTFCIEEMIFLINSNHDGHFCSKEMTFFKKIKYYSHFCDEMTCLIFVVKKDHFS